MLIACHIFHPKRPLPLMLGRNGCAKLENTSLSTDVLTNVLDETVTCSFAF